MAVRRTLVIILWCWTAVLSGAARAAEQDPVAEDGEVREAQVRFRHGIELYKEGDVTGALAQLTRAYELAPTFKILYNLAQVSCERGDDASALNYFKRYLADGGAEVPEERRGEVEDEIARLERRTSRATDVADADSTLPLNTAAPRLRIPQHQLDLKTGATPAVPAAPTVPASPGPADPPRDRVHPHPHPYPHPTRGTPWFTWTVAGVLAVGAVVTGVMALNTSTELQQRLNTFPASPGQVDDLRVSERRLGLAADGLTVSSAVAVAVALYLTFSDPSTSESATPHQVALLQP